MQKKFRKYVLCFVAMLCLLLFPGMNAEAAFDAPHYTWNIDGGAWDGTYYRLNGEVVTNAFFCDNAFTYFLQADGTPMKDRLTYHPNGREIIYFDEEGHEVFYQEKHITKSIEGEDISMYCYFNAEGYMYKNQLTFKFSPDTQRCDQPVYYNANGAKQMGGQFVFPDGNLGVADENGNLLYGGFGYDAFGQIVYFHWNGTIARGLITDGDYYYDMDLKDGHLKGWFSAEGVEDSAIFPGNINKADGSYVGIQSLYDMRLVGNNAITDTITDWYALDDVTTYMAERYGTENDWKLDIYKDATGNTTDSETKDYGVYATFRGVRLGDSREAVRAAYNGVGLSREMCEFYENHWTGCFESFTNEKVDEYIISYEKDIDNTVGWLENMVTQYSNAYGIRFYYDDNNCVERIQYFYCRTANNGVKRVVTKYKDVPLPVDFDASLSKYANENTTYQWCEWGVHEDTPMEGATAPVYQLTAEEYGDAQYRIFVCKLTDTVTGEVTEAYFMVDNGGE